MKDQNPLSWLLAIVEITKMHWHNEGYWALFQLENHRMRSTQPVGAYTGLVQCTTWSLVGLLKFTAPYYC